MSYIVKKDFGSYATVSVTNTDTFSTYQIGKCSNEILDILKDALHSGDDPTDVTIISKWDFLVPDTTGKTLIKTCFKGHTRQTSRKSQTEQKSNAKKEFSALDYLLGYTDTLEGGK